jgi:hypothetical protein
MPVRQFNQPLVALPDAVTVNAESNPLATSPVFPFLFRKISVPVQRIMRARRSRCRRRLVRRRSSCHVPSNSLKFIHLNNPVISFFEDQP